MSSGVPPPPSPPARTGISSCGIFRVESSLCEKKQWPLLFVGSQRQKKKPRRLAAGGGRRAPRLPAAATTTTVAHNPPAQRR